MNVKKYKENNYQLHSIYTDTFRACHLSIVFRQKFNPELIIPYSMIADLITDVSKNYPSKKQTVRYLENSYILDFCGGCNNTGSVIQTSITCNFVSPKYIKKKDYLENTIKFVFDMINNPYIDENGFEEKTFNVIKNIHLLDLKSCEEDHNFIAVHNALKFFDANSITSYHPYDMLEFAQNITRTDLYNYYKKLISESSIDIFVTGDVDGDEVARYVKKYFNFKTKYKNYDTLIENKERLLPQKKISNGIYSQSTLIMIFNINNMTMFEREFVVPFYLNILNSCGLTSKLYQSLREENGLCYNVNTNVYDRSNIMIVKSSIMIGKENKAINLVKKCIKAMKNNISDEEFINAYYLYESNMKNIVDSIGAINRIYKNKLYLGFSDYEEKQKLFKKVKIADIYNLAKKVKLNTIYVQKGDLSERNKD